MSIATPIAVLFVIAGTAHASLLLLVFLSRHRSNTRTTLLIACALTAGSAVTAAWSGPLGVAGAGVEFAGLGGWCVFVLHLLNKRIITNRRLFASLCGCVAVIGVLMLGFPLLQLKLNSDIDAPLTVFGELSPRLSLAIFGILLIENLYRNTAYDARWHINLLCIALGGMFFYSVVIYADALLYTRISPLLWGGRAIVMTIATPLIAVAIARSRGWNIDIHVSRSVVFHTATFIAAGIFLLALSITGEIFRTFNPGWGDLAEVALVVAGAAVIGVVFTSASARSRLQHMLLDNFYSHRYDYRHEWLKSITLLSAAPNRSSVQSRVITAVAEIADSPAGVLWVRDLEGTAFLWAGSCNHPAVSGAEPADSAFVAQFRDAEWIIEVDKASNQPIWLAEIKGAWLAVPLAQQEDLIGFIILAKPRAPLKLDREIFDLLRIVGRQAATHIAEQRYAQALVDTRELHSYGKRFAFAIHDMKNVVGQLAMILQNARHHNDNPEFHEDVLITVRSAVDRMNRLLERLRTRQPWQTEEFIAPADLIREEVMAIERSYGVQIEVEDAGPGVSIAMDAEAFRSVIRHLCENAVEASPNQVQLRLHQDALRLQIQITDRGAGMTPEFIRDKLFQPFGSSKCDGLGIGAYQAREIVRAAGGDLLVTSRSGTGTTMSIVLPCSASRLNEISPA